MRELGWLLLLWAGIGVGCNGGGGAGGGGHGIDGGVDGGADAGADAPIDTPPADAPPDARPPGPAIMSTATIGGFTQIRHGYEGGLEGFADRLSIDGIELADASSVMLGPLTGTIVSATGTQVLADVDIPHGFAPGPLAVTVSGPTWSVTSPNPITITRIVVGPGASPGGRGTDQSPAALCEPLVAYARAGALLDLLAGTHMCNSAVPLPEVGIEIRGAGIGSTVIAPGFLGFIVGNEGVSMLPTRLHDLTVLAPGGPVIELQKGTMPIGPLIVERLQVEGGTAGAVSLQQYGPSGSGVESMVQIDDLSYAGAGTAIDLEYAMGSIAHTTIQGCEIGIHHRQGTGSVAVSTTAIDDCATGIVIGELDVPWFEPEPGLTMQTSHIHAGSGVLVRRGDVSLEGIEVTASGHDGLWLAHGSLTLTAGTQVMSAHTAVTVAASSDQYVALSATDADLVGDRIGLDYASSEATALFLRNTLVQGGDLGLRLHTYTSSTIDLGMATMPGGNALVGGMFAYTLISDYFGTYHAVGTTLNGTSYAGQLLTGPASSPPDYDIQAPLIGTQF